MEKQKVMVALRDVETAESLTRLACQMASLAGADLIALHVIEVPPGLPLDAEAEVLSRPGEQTLSLAREIASANFAGQIFTKFIRARDAGPAIVDQAAEEGVELLIIGYHHNHGLAEKLLGSTVRYVAHHAPCKVLVQIPAPKVRA